MEGATVTIGYSLRSAGLGSALLPSLLNVEARADVVRERFAVGGGGRLVVDASVGSIRVTAREGDIVEVEVRRTGLFPHPILTMEQDGDDVVIESHGVPVLRWLPPWAGLQSLRTRCSRTPARCSSPGPGLQS